MSWDSDTRSTPTVEALRDGAAAQPRGRRAPRTQAAPGKQRRRRLEGRAADPAGAAALPPDARLRVRHAKRGSVEEAMSLDAFLKQCEPYFAAGGGMIDQAYQPRLTDGMVRCYLVGDRVAGFGEQQVNALYPAAPGTDPRTAPPPGPRLYYPPTGRTSSR